MSRALRATAAFSLAAAWPATAAAQTIPDIQDATIVGQQVNAAVDRAAARGADPAATAQDTIDGEAGVYVLRFNDIFYVQASGGIGYSSNPSRTATDAGGSFDADAGLSAGVATVVGGAFDLGLSATVAGREFFDDDAPSNRTVSGTLSAGKQIGRVYVGLIGFGGYSFDRDFKGPTSFYGGSANVSVTLPLSRRLALRPGIGATRQWSGTSENDSTTAGASLDLLFALSPRLNGYLHAAVSRRWYDDFYEDVTAVERRDWQYQGGGGLSYRLTRTVAVGINAGVERQRSTFFLSEYDAFDVSAVASIRLAF